jgi:uncharacterized surface protein with fasciclin (FAS1) repeats
LDTAAQRRELSTFAKYLKKHEWMLTVQSPTTVFAPTNEAFAKHYAEKRFRLDSIWMLTSKEVHTEWMTYNPQQTIQTQCAKTSRKLKIQLLWRLTLFAWMESCIL